MALPLSRAAVARIAPFTAFMLLQAARGLLPAEGAAGITPQGLDAAAVLIVAALLAWFWREYGELVQQTLPSTNEALVAVGLGVLVFVLWIQLDAPVFRIGASGAGFVPTDSAGQPNWPLIAMHWIGSALLVPVVDELFWRSFLMRWMQSPRFESVVPQQVGVKAIVLTTFVFVLAHTWWLAAAIAGLVYAMLYGRTGKLWVPITAHAVTNGLLGAWALHTRQWALW
jgi:uncharacterized protein